MQIHISYIHICSYCNVLLLLHVHILALESQGRPILNGGLTVRGTSPFSDIGSTFQYVRNPTEESVSTPGPLQAELTVMVSI